MNLCGAKRLAALGVATLMCWSMQVSAVVISVNDWSLVNSFDNDVGRPLFRVTETFTPAAELNSVLNRYEYRFENLTSNLTASLFRVGQVVAIRGRELPTSPAGWSLRPVRTNLWETRDASRFVAPGASLDGFSFYSRELFPAERRNAGWIVARDSAGTRVNVFGSLIRQTASVPEPGALMLLGLGLFGLCMRRSAR